jgi:hypothetical protein
LAAMGTSCTGHQVDNPTESDLLCLLHYTQAAVDHLIAIGFLSREDVRRAGGVNLLWGLLLQEINAQVNEGLGNGHPAQP